MTLSQQPITQSKLDARPPAHPVFVGYWHNWNQSAAPYLPLQDVSQDYDLVHIAFALADPTTPGGMIFEPCIETTPQDFKNDIRALQDRGQKVLLSVGGATGSPAMETSQARRNFVRSLIKLLYTYQFDGLDINLEGTIRLDSNDTNFEKPTSASILQLTEALHELRIQLGPQRLLSLSPQLEWVQGGLSAYAGFQGAYLPVLEQCRNILNYIHIQHYNSNPQKGLDGHYHSPNSASFHAAMAEMLLRGFPIAGNPDQVFRGLRPEQIGIGLPSCPQIVSSGYAAPEALQNALQTRRFGALMTWSINWDAVHGMGFSRPVRAWLNVQ